MLLVVFPRIGVDGDEKEAAGDDVILQGEIQAREVTACHLFSIQFDFAPKPAILNSL